MVVMVIGFDLDLTEKIGELSMSKVLVEAEKKTYEPQKPAGFEQSETMPAGSWVIPTWCCREDYSQC